MSRNNLHPVRGRKLIHTSYMHCVTHETTHTPPGDENSIRAGSRFNLLFGNNLYPARGRKLVMKCVFVTVKSETTYTPVRGRKLYCISEFLYAFARNNSRPARGRKPDIQIHGIYSEETTHTPLGDENPSSIVLRTCGE